MSKQTSTVRITPRTRSIGIAVTTTPDRLPQRPAMTGTPRQVIQYRADFKRAVGGGINTHTVLWVRGRRVVGSQLAALDALRDLVRVPMLASVALLTHQEPEISP